MLDLTDKVALVTGAQQGMGKAHAKALAKQGATVVLTDIKADICERVVQEITDDGGKATCFAMDVSNAEQVDEVFTKVVQQFGRLDILINNAGIYKPRPALELTQEEWEQTIHINLRGQFNCAQRAAKEMKKNNWGRIVNIASVASGQTGIGIAGGAHYTASKGGILGMTETLADEWAQYGILVNAIAPGAIDTPMASSADMPKEVLEGLLAKIPLHRMGTAEEVTNLAVFLSSEEASYITGAVHYIDGGWLAA